MRTLLLITGCALALVGSGYLLYLPVRWRVFEAERLDYTARFNQSKLHTVEGLEPPAYWMFIPKIGVAVEATVAILVLSSGVGLVILAAPFHKPRAKLVELSRKGQ